jgi:hypothetical protein
MESIISILGSNNKLITSTLGSNNELITSTLGSNNELITSTLGSNNELITSTLGSNNELITTTYNSNDEIDIVYLYVNSTTREWYNEYSKYKKDVCPDRFSFNGEIYFSLLSVQRFMPFVRNVFLIISGPDQHLDLNMYDESFKNKIKYVYHKDIIPEKYLPTFNSTVI